MNSSHTLWYALQVQTRLGITAAATLRGKGYEELLPLYPVRRRWSDRIKESLQPLFPGYMFCRLDPEERLLAVLTTPGITGIVSAGKTPIPIPDEEIGDIRHVLRSGLAPQPWPFLQAGSRVAIERGALAGLRGIVIKTEKAYRLVVSITLLQRSVAVEIDRSLARPVQMSPTPGNGDPRFLELGEAGSCLIPIRGRG